MSPYKFLSLKKGSFVVVFVDDDDDDGRGDSIDDISCDLNYNSS